MTSPPARSGRSLAGYLRAWEVAQLARAAKGQTWPRTSSPTSSAPSAAYAGGGTVLADHRQGRAGPPARPRRTTAGTGPGLITWRLLRRVVADGVTPERLAALNKALRDKKPTVARRAAQAIVTAGPPVTQLDLLDQLDGRRTGPRTSGGGRS